MSPDELEVADFEGDQAVVVAGLRDIGPVAWVRALDAWLVTSRAVALEVMRDAERFTVDDPRFSTAVVLGKNMLSLDGPEHTRRRAAFAPHFRPSAIRGAMQDSMEAEARRLLEGCLAGGSSEMCSQFAAPLAVSPIIRFLGLDVDAADLLGGDSERPLAIDEVSMGGTPSAEAQVAVGEIDQAVRSSAVGRRNTVVRAIHETGVAFEELSPDAAVTLFGAIETSEAMTATLLWHLLTNPEALRQVGDDRSLLAAAIEESLRLDPAAAVVDRYATADVDIGGASIQRGDLVRVSLLGANRDPAEFVDPDRFDPTRPNVLQQLSFASGPHVCLGAHLARAETCAGVDAFLDRATEANFDESASGGPRGFIFRKPAAVWVGRA